MRIASRIQFADDKVKKSFANINQYDKQLFKWLTGALNDIEKMISAAFKSRKR